MNDIVAFQADDNAKDINVVIEETTREPSALPLKCVSLKELLSMDFPPRTNLLAPWLPLQGLAQVHAPRGVGKTFFALGVAVAVSSGSEFLHWHAPEPQPVLYLDGEMPGVVMQERLWQLTKYAHDRFDTEILQILNPDLQEFGMPDLATYEGQRALKNYTDRAKLIIVDNISTLCRTGAENRADDWALVQEWGLRMRSEGRSVLYIHHSGKTGTQRGTSRREDVLDTVIALRHPPDYSPSDGAHFEVHFEKSRGIIGDDVEPFEAKLTIVDDKQVWTTKSLAISTREKVASLLEEGYEAKEMPELLGVNKSTVYRAIKKISHDQA